MLNRLMFVATLTAFPLLLAAAPQDASTNRPSNDSTLPRPVIQPTWTRGNVSVASPALTYRWEQHTQQRVVDKKIEEAARSFRQAKPAEREQAEEQLRNLLSDDYDDRLASYDEYLGELEKQIDEMRIKLEKRRRAKPEMIDLRVQVLEAEADDLGWPTRMSKNSFPRRLLPPNSNDSGGAR